ncbi:hypothetical protein HMPREF0373_01580 [Eubacterium ramulus ATCC 29099]|uniref:Uncharacterized protein n=1 Tax=Eubacterium ramulus ATCC 29099 TaxID=1256908 RepID=U2P8V4_EUBRA|nr:hypothetical protein HMPREF0373_01580 [Eubacterium ramulus ATCC 29099]
MFFFLHGFSFFISQRYDYYNIYAPKILLLMPVEKCVLSGKKYSKKCVKNNNNS